MLEAIFSADALWYLLLLLYVPACALLIVVVLLQKGKGMGFAGAFGMGGASEAVFGPRAVRSLPQKITYTMAGLFMVLAMMLSMISGRVGRGVAPEAVPVEDASAAAAIDQVFDENAAPAADGAATATPTTTVAEPAADSAAPATTPVAEPAPAADAAAPAEAAPAEAVPAEAAPAEPAPAEAAPAADAAPAESAPAQQ